MTFYSDEGREFVISPPSILYVTNWHSCEPLHRDIYQRWRIQGKAAAAAATVHHDASDKISTSATHNAEGCRGLQLGFTVARSVRVDRLKCSQLIRQILCEQMPATDLMVICLLYTSPSPRD